MSKDVVLLEDIKRFLNPKNIQDIKEIKVRIQQWGFSNVRDWYYPKVCLQDWVLYWNLTSGQKLEVNGKIIHPDSKKVYLFPPYTKFGGIIEKEFTQFYVHFRASAPFDSVRTEFIEFPSEPIQELVYQAVSSNFHEMQSLYLTQTALTALSFVPQKMLMPSRKTILDSRIRHVLEHINQNPGGRNSIEELAEYVKMSVNNFHRKFQSCTFQTPKQYIMIKRMEFARELLMNGDLSIDEIAEQAGFANRYHFSKAFKNYYSFPPITYRKKMSSQISK